MGTDRYGETLEQMQTLIDEYVCWRTVSDAMETFYEKHREEGNTRLITETERLADMRREQILDRIIRPRLLQTEVSKVRQAFLVEEDLVDVVIELATEWVENCQRSAA
jgi:hypothetical protein